MRMHNALLQS